MNHELLQSTFSDLASQTDYAATNYVHDPEHIQAECDAYERPITAALQKYLPTNLSLTKHHHI